MFCCFQALQGDLLVLGSIGLYSRSIYSKTQQRNNLKIYTMQDTDFTTALPFNCWRFCDFSVLSWYIIWYRNRIHSGYLTKNCNHGHWNLWRNIFPLLRRSQDFTLLCFSVFSNLVLTGSVDEELELMSNTEAFIFSFTLGAVTRLV